MPPPHIFVSTRSRREYPRRRPLSYVLPVSMMLFVAFVVLLWALAVIALWWGGV